MKKSILIAIAVIGLTAASCRKERTCECKQTQTEVRIGYGEKTKVENSSWKITKAKQKKGAFKYSSDCFSKTNHYDNSGGNGVTAWSSVTTVESTCELK
jgi:hypothetical protein